MHPSSRVRRTCRPLALLAAALAGACLAAQAADATRAAPAPVEAYAELPDAEGARLSPDGRRLAFIGVRDGHAALLVEDLDGQERTKVLTTGDGELTRILWKSDQRLVIALRFAASGPLLKISRTRLVALDRDGGHMVELVQSKNGDFQPQVQDRIISELPDDPDHLLLQLPWIDRSTTRYTAGNDFNDRIHHPEVVRVDVHTGATERVVRQHGLVGEWIATPAGDVELGWAMRRDRSADLLALDRATSTWKTVFSQSLAEGGDFEPLAPVDGRPGHFYVLSNHETGHDALYEFDTGTARYVRTVAADPGAEVEALQRDGRLLGYEIPGQPPVYLDPAWAADASLAARALPDAHIRIVDRSRDGRRALLRVTRGNEPANYWTLTRGAGGPADLAAVTDAYPGLDAARIAPSRWETVTARDGLPLPVLVTLPEGYRPGPGAPALPFVVLPHGGPASHDVRRFDYWVQYLASRGYGVLQPQFRGSSGYGRAFLTAGYRQWGLAMQDDVTDATRWLVRQGYADPRRIAIVGGGYGGYAALMGVAKEPLLYRCAVAIAPVSDLPALVEEDEKRLHGDLDIDTIGADPATLERTSPARLADRVRVPVLLVHGRRDTTVPVEQSETMERALEKAGKPVQAVYLAGADHYFTVQADRERLLRELERFLAANLGAEAAQAQARIGG